jgi:iron complex transport system substrate-binding protein
MLKPRNVLKLCVLFAALVLGHAETAAAHEVTDVLGRKVDVADNVKRVVLGEGRLISAFALLDRDAPFQRIVGWQNDLKLLDQHTYNAYVAKFPSVKDIPLIGQASEQSVSAEEILSLKPDLAVFSISGHGPTHQHERAGPGAGARSPGQGLPGLL